MNFERIDNMAKAGLIVEGGASRTYFAVGAMDYLMENNIKVDYIIGSSAGIANSVNYASGQKGRALKIALEHVTSKKYMGIRHLLNPKNRSYYNIKYAFNVVPTVHVPFDFEAFAKYTGEVKAAVTNVETGCAEYLDVEGNDNNWRVVLASCSLPIMFPPVEIDGKTYLDGGIADSIPYMHAIEEGCDKIIVILSRERTYSKDSGKGTAFASFLYRKYPEFVKVLKNRPVMYNEQREKLFELEKQGKAIIIEPESTKGWKRCENRREFLQDIYDKGYATAKNKFEEIKKYLTD